MLKTIQEITYYSSPKLESFPGLTHAFLGRTGGVSKGHLHSLNMGRGEEDTAENLAENKRRVGEAFGFQPSRIFTVSQVHSDRIVILDDPDKSPDELKSIEADAIITNIKGAAIGILTADCVPVLLYDHNNGVIAAIHAGWKGTAHKISKKTVNAMKERFGTKPEDITAAIGPAIGMCCYKVQDDVVMAVGNIDKVTKTCEFHWCLDLAKANLIDLEEAGISKIDSSNLCTSCSFHLFYSHRKERGMTGRQLSFIAMRES